MCVFQCQPTALLRASDSTQGGYMALSVVYFPITHRLCRPHYVWDEYLYSVREKVEVRVTVSVTVCVVLLCCVEWWWKEGRRWLLLLLLCFVCRISHCGLRLFQLLPSFLFPFPPYLSHSFLVFFSLFLSPNSSCFSRFFLERQFLLFFYPYQIIVCKSKKHWLRNLNINCDFIRVSRIFLFLLC